MEDIVDTYPTTSFYKEVPVVRTVDIKYFLIINYNGIVLLIATGGVFANIINIVVFYKLGFHNTINISFYGMAWADLCGLLSMIWLCLCVNPLVIYSNVPMDTVEVLHLTGGIPHICFARIAGWITVFVTAERCLCITFPLKIKQIITPRVTAITICFIFASTILSFVPEYQTAYIDWKFYAARNRTLLGMLFTSERKSMEGIVFCLFSILGFVCFVSVTVFTVILIVQLKQKSGWRKQANVDAARAESISSRDNKTVRMVVMTAIVLIVCYIPGIVISLTCFLIPEYSVVGAYMCYFYISWSFAFIFEACNSSVNILLYYSMSTKYREMLTSMFRCSVSAT